MTKNNFLLKTDKRGLAMGQISALIGALIFVVLAVAVAPTMFTGLNETGGPSWLSTVLPVIVSAGLIFAIWKSFS